jgi:hypothetical protein
MIQGIDSKRSSQVCFFRRGFILIMDCTFKLKVRKNNQKALSEDTITLCLNKKLNESCIPKVYQRLKKDKRSQICLFKKSGKNEMKISYEYYSYQDLLKV